MRKEKKERKMREAREKEIRVSLPAISARTPYVECRRQKAGSDVVRLVR